MRFHILMLSPLIILASPCAAQITFTVTTTADFGDGIGEPSECTLRKALDIAPGIYHKSGLLIDKNLNVQCQDVIVE